MNAQFISKPTENPVPAGFPQAPLLRALPAVAIYPYSPRDVLELKLAYNQRLHILEAKGDWWYIARTLNGTEGWVPSSYVKLLETPQSLDMRNVYSEWSAKAVEAFRVPAKGEKKEKVDKLTFPWLPAEVCACEESRCWMRKHDRPLGACIHDVEMLLKGVGEQYNATWLWRQRLAWHPDRFVKKFKGAFEEEGMSAVAEMFTILTEISHKERDREKAEVKAEAVR